MAENAPRRPSASSELAFVLLPDHYVLSELLDAQSSSLIEIGSDNFHTIGRIRIHTREKAFSARWHYIGSRSNRFADEPRLHDAPVVDSDEEEWNVAFLGCPYGCALDANDAVDMPEEFRPEA